MNSTRLLDVSSLAEATTLAVLVFIAVPLKHFGGMAGGVHLMGPVHGLAFLVYFWTLMRAVGAGGWRTGEIVRMIAVACVPLAGFLNRPWLTRKLRALPETAADR